jgi:hypothetical protein
MMNFNDQDRQCCVTLSAASRSPELAKGKGLARRAERCFAALSMTGPVCVTLSAAKGLARWAERCFAALILRCAQDDRSGFDC